jgi:small subunit ribosomal protein S6
MRFYQTIVILRPDLDDAQIKENSEKVKGFIAKYDGEIVRMDNWGKKRLAYRIKKNRFGIYLNICHKLEGSQVDSLEKEFRLDETILKFLVVRLEADEFERICGQQSIFDDSEKKPETEVTEVSKDEEDTESEAETEAETETEAEAEAVEESN